MTRSRALSNGARERCASVRSRRPIGCWAEAVGSNGSASRRSRSGSGISATIRQPGLVGASRPVQPGGCPGEDGPVQDGDRWGVPSGAIPTTHILKPAVSGFDDHELNEHLCLDAARRAGLTASRTSVERFGDETAIVVARYDRRMTPKAWSGSTKRTAASPSV